MEAVVDVPVPHAGFALRGTRVRPEGSMILPIGVPAYFEKSEDLKKAVTAAFLLALNDPGCYTVWSGRNTSDPIRDLSYFEIPKSKEGNAWLTSTTN